MPRRLGQHFLVRRSTLDRIAAAACGERTAAVVEIGPGRGALTESLLPRCDRLLAIEVDRVLVHYLEQKFRDARHLTIVENDVLKTDLAQWGRVVVAGNLPYYITSPIVEKVLRLGPLLERGVFLVQKEVADRMTTGPGTRDYGYLSVQIALSAQAKTLFAVPPGAFNPPPKVDSAVVLLEPRDAPLVSDTPGFLRFASACFRQKRKMLRNNLAGLYPREVIEAQPEAAKRAEQLSIEALVDLYRRLSRG